jgi:IclR family KDG regulon transcriptional repressor
MPNGNKLFALRNSASNNTSNTTGIRSIRRAVEILLCLSNGVNSLADICSHTNLAKPTVYRILQTLDEQLMVTQDKINHRYYVGPLINKIASNPQTNHQYLINCSMEELKRLWDFSGETVELNIMVGFQYIRIYEIQSKFELKVVAGPDPVGPVFVGATAKVMLSQLDDDKLRLVLRHIKISRVTERSVIDAKDLMAQAKEIRRSGYAVSYGERIDHAVCISVPVKNYFWPVALSLVGPDSRLERRVDETLKQVMVSAQRITQNIEEFYRVKGGDNQRTVKMKR